RAMARLRGQAVPGVLARHADLWRAGCAVGHDRNRAVRGRVPESIRQEVEEHALDAARRTADVRKTGRKPRLEADASGCRLGLEPAQAHLDHRMERRFAFGRDGAGVELCELEEV